MSKLLEIKNLMIKFKSLSQEIVAVNDITFDVNFAEVVGIVGESGSGKSQTVLSIMGLLASNATVIGEVNFLGKNLLKLNQKELNKIRGNEVGIIFQDPMTSLNPYLTIENQMLEVLMLHKGFSKTQAFNECVRMLDFVRISDAKSRIKLYPHEFSGGMRQRVMIAMALLCKPKLLIADEPTTALDVTIQAQILNILQELRQEFSMSIILITHDMGVVANICDRVNVMYASQLLEKASVNEIFSSPKHPYTQALLGSMPKFGFNNARLTTIPGEPPNVYNLPYGCVFQKRCQYVHKKCTIEEIKDQHILNNRVVKCNLNIE